MARRKQYTNILRQSSVSLSLLSAFDLMNCVVLFSVNSAATGRQGAICSL